MFESCLRNYRSPILSDFFRFLRQTLHMLPVAVLRRAKRPFGPSASLASATTKNAKAFFFLFLHFS